MKSVILFFLLLLNFGLKSQDLNDYSWVVDRINIAAYDDPKNTIYSKDPKGIIKSNNEYHPLTLSMYGILNYYHFKQTGDSIYYKRHISQSNYFKNKDLLEYKLNNKGIALPYPFDFHELNKGWFSGMTQGTALSYILRYRKLTQRNDLDSVMHKIAYLLCQPVEKGGCISDYSTHPWIEEYPNSDNAIHVLNGAINGYIGLLEYTQKFNTNDSLNLLTKRVYESILYYLPHFNQMNWARYDLGKRMCDPGYMRLHIYQMRSMFELTKNDLFKRQEMLWAAQLNGREHIDSTNRVKYLKTHISKLQAPAFGKWYLPKGIEMPKLSPFYKIDSILNPRIKEHRIVISFKDTGSFDYLLFQAENKMNISKISIHLNQNDSIILKGSSYHQLDNKTIHLRLLDLIKVQPGNQLVIQYKSEHRPKNPLFSFQNRSHPNTTWFGHYYTEEVPLDSNQTYQFYLPNIEINYLKIFYKYGENIEEIQNNDFNPLNYVKSTTFTPNKNGVYKFLICFEKENNLSMVGPFQFKAIKEKPTPKK